MVNIYRKLINTVEFVPIVRDYIDTYVRVYLGLPRM